MSFKWIIQYIISCLLLFVSTGYTYYWDSNKGNLIIIVLNIIGWILYYKTWITANNKRRQYLIIFFFIFMILFLIPAIINLYTEEISNILEYTIIMLVVVFLINILSIYKEINNKKVIIENIVINIKEALANNKYKKALKYAHKLKCKNIILYYYIKGSIFSAKNNIKAKFYLRISEILSLCSRNKFIRAKIYSRLANIFIRDEQINKAISISIKALKNYQAMDDIKEEYYQCLYKLAVLYYKQEKYLKAIPYLKKIIINNESYPIKRNYLLACIYYQVNDINKSENLFLNLIKKKLYNKTKEKLDIYYWLIKIYFKKNENQKKIDFLFKGLSEDEGFYVSYKWPVNIFSICEKERIYNYFKERYFNNKISVKLFNSLIYLCYKLNKEEEFIEYTKLIEKFYPDHKDVTYWKIIKYIKSNDFAQAKDLYRTILDKEPGFYEQYTWEETQFNPAKIKDILKCD